MSGVFELKDGRGTRRRVGIDASGNLLVSVDPNPRISRQTVLPFRSYFLNGESNDMRVDGSSSEVNFEITAHSTRDRYIAVISFVVADANAILSKFGNLTALTNGCRLWFTREDEGELDIHDAIKTNWDLVRLCQGVPAYGTAVDAFRSKNVVGAAEAYIPVLDLKTFLPPYGLKLDAASPQKLVMTIRDDLATGMNSFDAIGYGFEILPVNEEEIETGS